MSYEITTRAKVTVEKPDVDSAYPNNLKAFRGNTPELGLSETLEGDEEGYLFIDNISLRRLNYYVYIRRANFDDRGDYKLYEVDTRTGMRRKFKVTYEGEERVSLEELLNILGVEYEGESIEDYYDYDMEDLLPMIEELESRED